MSAEDFIGRLVFECEWRQKAGYRRQLRGPVGALAARGNDLDLVYIERWVGGLQLRDPWQKVRGS